MIDRCPDRILRGVRCLGNDEHFRMLQKKWNKPQNDKMSMAKVKMDQIKAIMITNIGMSCLNCNIVLFEWRSGLMMLCVHNRQGADSWRETG